MIPNLKTLNRSIKRLFTYKTFLVGLLAFSIVLLSVSTIFIGYKSAAIHSHNSDQLVDGYMFSSAESFQDAIFPAAHTLLIKWPIFVLSAALDNTPKVYELQTVALFFVTVMGFLLVLYFLSGRNKLVTSCLALALASTLLLIPAQPDHTVLLPVNLAMITTRNIEFLLFFIYIFLLIKARRVKSYYFFLAVLTLIILGATDKFFLMLALGASLLYLAINISARKRWPDYAESLPFVSAIIGFLGVQIFHTTLDKSGFTNIPAPASAAPFNISSSVMQTIEGLAGAIQGTIVNFGADIFGRPVTPKLLPFLLNGLVLAVCLTTVILLYFKNNRLAAQKQTSWQFGYWLVLSSIVAYALFIFSDHDFLVDARYLTIGYFAGFASVAVYSRIFPKQQMTSIAAFSLIALLVTVPISFLAANRTLNNAVVANQSLHGDRSKRIAKAVASNNATVLIGDYWLVIPVKNHLPSLTVAPITPGMCDPPYGVLISKKWFEPDPNVSRAAYYLQQDENPSGTYNNGCTLKTFEEKYGRAAKQVVLKGDHANPTELLLIYDYDLRRNLR